MASQGIVGQQAKGMVTPADADPTTEGATFDTVTYGSGDSAVAAVAADPDDPLKCTVLLVGVGTTAITCTVDPGEGDPLEFAVDVEAQAPTPGEAVGGTFVLDEFEPVAV